MFKVKSALTAFGVMMACAIAAPLASAQSVIVVDTARVLRDSLGGQDLYSKVETIGQSMQAELAPAQTALQSERQTLDTQVAGMTREQVEANPELVAQLQSYSRRLQTHMASTERRSRELQQTETNALNIFAARMQEATETVRAARGADIVLAGVDVYLASETVNVTDEVIAQLNQTSPTIPVTRVVIDENAEQAAQ